ncbi:MAG: DUF3562 domain-containing protein [Desulfuromonadales bacterium]|nr:DUF3562 domain-containing protein [Desulfuromonadales bacterium]
MTIQIPFKDEIEKSQHEEAINQLLEEFPEYRDIVRVSYLENLQRLIIDATIRTYLPIFVSRQVKDFLGSRH